MMSAGQNLSPDVKKKKKKLTLYCPMINDYNSNCCKTSLADVNLVLKYIYIRI